MQHKQLARKFKYINNIPTPKENLLSIQNALWLHLHTIREDKMPHVPWLEIGLRTEFSPNAKSQYQWTLREKNPSTG